MARPVALGSLGVRDLERTSLFLRLRWLWFSRTNDRRPWQGLDMQFTPAERDFFFASTTMEVGNVLTAKFWEDRWIRGQSIKDIAPLLHSCIPKRRRKTRMVANTLLDHRWAQDIQGTIGIQEISQYLQLWHTIDDTIPTNEPDRLIWKWTANGSYTASCLPGLLPWILGLPCVETYLEGMGTPAPQVLPLASLPRPMLDHAAPRAPWPTAPSAMPAL
uniref:Uncharacterized protein n=1 Tax=Avena sativa TaxID=4498 RepID=A0ACD5VWR5_AVESA